MRWLTYCRAWERSYTLRENRSSLRGVGRSVATGAASRTAMGRGCHPGGHRHGGRRSGTGSGGGRAGQRAAVLRAEIGVPVRPNLQADLDRTLAKARAALGEETFAAAWTRGHERPLSDVIAAAAEVKITSSAPVSRRVAVQETDAGPVSRRGNWTCCGCWWTAGLTGRSPRASSSVPAPPPSMSAASSSSSMSRPVAKPPSAPSGRHWSSAERSSRRPSPPSPSPQSPRSPRSRRLVVWYAPQRGDLGRPPAISSGVQRGARPPDDAGLIPYVRIPPFDPPTRRRRMRSRMGNSAHVPPRLDP